MQDLNEEEVFSIDGEADVNPVNVLYNDPTEECEGDIDLVVNDSPYANYISNFTYQLDENFISLETVHLSNNEEIKKEEREIPENDDHLIAESSHSKDKRKELCEWLVSSQFWSFDQTEYEDFIFHQEKIITSKEKDKKNLIVKFSALIAISILLATLFSWGFIGCIFGLGCLILLNEHRVKAFAHNYIVKKQDEEIVNIKHRLEHFQAVHIKFLKEISDCFSYIQEMQLVAQGFKSSRNSFGVAPITRLEFQAKNKQCENLRRKLRTSIEKRILELQTIFKHPDKTLTEELHNQKQFADLTGCFSDLIAWHKIKCDIQLDEDLDKMSLVYLKNLRNYYTQCCSEVSLLLLFSFGYSTKSGFYWKPLNILAQYNRLQFYKYVNDYINTQISKSCKYTEKLQKIIYAKPVLKNIKSDQKFTTQKSDKPTNENTERKLMEKFLVISRELRNHLSTIETSLLIFENETISSYSNNFPEPTALLDQFRLVHSQLLHASEKWQMGNQQLVNLFTTSTAPSFSGKISDNDASMEYNPYDDKQQSFKVEQNDEEQIFEGYTGKPQPKEEYDVSQPTMMPTLLHLLLGGANDNEDNEDNIFPGFNLQPPVVRSYDISNEDTINNEERTTTNYESFSFLQGNLMSELDSVLQKRKKPNK